MIKLSNKKSEFIRQHYFHKNNTGFTMIELLIVIGITTILAAVSSVVYGNLQVSTQLNETSAQITQNLRIAHDQSVAGLNNSAHGVKFDTNQYILYQGSSYATRDSSYDRAHSLSSVTSLTTTLTNNEVSFSKGVGVPGTIGTITITHSVNGSRAVSVNSLGIILEL